MKLWIVGKAGCLAALLMVQYSAFAQASGAATPESARAFVQGFYNWYTPMSVRDDPPRPWDFAVKQKRFAFSSELARLLLEDSNAQAHCGELVGLDFDPFLFSQDLAQRYEVGEIRQSGRVYRADVYAVDHGNRSRKPDVIAEFTEDNGRWTFVNFHYLDPNSDLLTILKARAECTVPRSPSS